VVAGGPPAYAEGVPARVFQLRSQRITAGKGEEARGILSQASQAMVQLQLQLKGELTIAGRMVVASGYRKRRGCDE